jgi:hypothetical protein
MYINAITINSTTPQYFFKKTRISITLLMIWCTVRAATVEAGYALEYSVSPDTISAA